MRIPLITTHDATGHIHLVVGTNAIAHQRCQRSLAAGAKPIILSDSQAPLHHALQDLVGAGAIVHLPRSFQDSDILTLGRSDVNRVVDAVFITSGRASPQNAHISALCKRARIPVNVTDSSALSSFSLPALHADGPLQVAVSTSGMGCKLAARIRRHVYSSLPPHLGQGVARLGALRKRLQEADRRDDDDSDDDSPGQPSSFNAAPGPAEAATVRRMRHLAQVCEHWPLARLASISEDDVDALAAAYMDPSSSPAASLAVRATPRIVLAGAGPGSPALLTLATHAALQAADLVLADKLVPAAVLALVPRRTPVRIAEKFPGNADAAQAAFLSAGLAALKHGLNVLRLKQGDPYVYGRGGEEVLFFRAAGFEPVVLPGLTSALVAPLAAGVPATHRGVAEEVRVCTGVGRKGRAVGPGGYRDGVTWVCLMVLNRLAEFVAGLTGEGGEGPASDPPFPLDTPCAVVERATCRDQRVVRSTLRHVVAAFEEAGSRPPGLLVVGAACGVLGGAGGKKWVVEEGYGALEEVVGGVDGPLAPVEGDVLGAPSGTVNGNGVAA